MKKYTLSLIVLAITLFSFNVLAWSPPSVPANGGHIVDLAQKLSSTELSQLEQKIEAVNSATHNEMGILILPSMDGNNIEDVAQTTFRSWGIGKKGIDNGVLIVIAIAERKSRIQTGKGVEGDLPDLKCNDILLQNLNPHLKKGDFFGGLNETLDSISSSIVSHKTTPTATTQSNNTGCQAAPGTTDNGYTAVFVLTLFFVGFIYLLYRWSQKSKLKLQKDLQAEYLKKYFEVKPKAIEKPFKFPELKPLPKLEDIKPAIKFEREIPLPPPVPAVVEVTTKPVIAPVRPATTQSSVTSTKPIYFPPPHSNIKRTSNPPASLSKEEPFPLVTRKILPLVTPAVNYKKQEEDRAYQKRLDEERDKRRLEDEESDRKRRQRDDEDRRRRDQEDEDRRRRDREEQERSSSSSSSSSTWSGWDSGSSSGSGFGGGDSGGGGSSSDF